MSSGSGGLPFLNIVEGWVHGAHLEGGFSVSGKLLIIAFASEIVAFFFVAPFQSITNFEFVLFLAPIWVPVLLLKFTIMRYVQWRKVNFIAHPQQDTVLLEIKVPRDTRKPPLAMEAIFMNLNIASGEGTWYKRNVLGRARPWYSFELVSLGGKVHLYVWVRQRFRRAVETFMYAQYPGVEVIEAVDYSRVINPTHPPYRMFSVEYAKKKLDAFPIKTYTDYALETPQKPEETVDPMAQMLEMLGSIGPKEQVWLQIIIRATKYEKYAGRKTKKGQQYTWRDEGKEEVERIREELIIQSEYVDPSGKLQKTKGFPNPTEGQKDRIKSIERNTGKLAYDVGLRGVYCAEGDAYHKSMGSLMANAFKPFASEMYNSISPLNRWSEYFNDYPWEDPSGHHLAHAMHSVLEFYRRRAFFYPPYTGQWSTMSVEELATIFHIPSSSVTTPSLPRIQSSTSEAPSNLPI